MTLILEFKVTILTIDPTGTRAQEWMNRGKLFKDMGKHHLLHIFPESLVLKQVFIKSAKCV